MKNYALKKDPCSFLKLCISPWEVLILLLLCSLLSGAFLLFPTVGILLPGFLLIPIPFSPLSLLNLARGGGSGASRGSAGGGTQARGAAWLAAADAA
jgi:hypothetical protein